MRRVGALFPLAESDPEQAARRDALRRRLEQLGWASGRNLQLDFRFNGNPDRFVPLAKELVAAKPDVLHRLVSRQLRSDMDLSRRAREGVAASPAGRPLDVEDSARRERLNADWCQHSIALLCSSLYPAALKQLEGADMSNMLPKDLQHIPPTTLTNRRDFLTSGTIAGLTTASAFTQLLAGSTAEAQGQYTTKSSIATPNKYNLRDVAGSNYITEVRDQGICNSCTAYAVVAAIEGAISVKQNTPNPQIHLSEEQLFTCAGPGCDTNAWYPDRALTYCRDFGLAKYSEYGPRDGVCHVADLNLSYQKISDFPRLLDASAMKQCISGTGPFTQASPVVSLFVYYQDLWDWAPNSNNKVYKHKDNGNPHDEVRIGGHAVCIVGYDDSPGYWICKNSWGTGWGGAGNGFFNISYGDCHIDDFRMYGIVLP